MTARAFIIGLLGAVFVCGFTYFNDHVIRQTYLVGSSLPTGVYGVLLLIVIANPLLDRLRPGWALSGRELAVALALTLSACCIPSAGLMETFPDALMMPHHHAMIKPGWKDRNVLSMVPDYMLADVSAGEDKALTGYVQGLSTGNRHISPLEVPWSAWTRTLAFWLPLVVVLWGALIGLCALVHRQWVHNEQLPFPIATFASSLLPGDGGLTSPILRQRLFWLGCAGVCVFHAVNYVHTWWPARMISFPRIFDFTPLLDLFPTLRAGDGWVLFIPRIFFAVVGLSYFLPKDVSFSLGIGPIPYYFLAGTLAGMGVSVSGGYSVPTVQNSLQAGAWLGFAAMTLYAGRYYYLNALGSALGLRMRERASPEAVWGARALLICSGIFAAILAATGLGWIFSIFFTVLVLCIFLVIARMSAETGHIFIQPYWAPGVFILGLLGAKAVGPVAAAIIFMVSNVLLVDTRESLVSFLANALHVLDRRDASVGKGAALAAGAVILGLAVAVPVTLYLKYDRGTDLAYGWASDMVPRFPFESALDVKEYLEARGELAEAESASGWQRMSFIKPSGKMLAWAGVGLAAVVLLSFLRYRIPRWPLHPAFLLVWTTFPGWFFAPSFLLGCIIKWAVVRYGGDAAYRKLKPLMVGLIAADMLTGLATSTIGTVYYFVTGQPPPKFGVLVG